MGFSLAGANTRRRIDCTEDLDRLGALILGRREPNSTSDSAAYDRVLRKIAEFAAILEPWIGA